MSVIATIHQPSSQLLNTFDKIICLSEGYMIYSGPAENVDQYFLQFGLKPKKFANPADRLIKIASMPAIELNKDVTIEQLAANICCEDNNTDEG